MRVIPVIDLKQGQVVRGVGGRRDQYRPIESRLCAGAEPAGVAQAFARLGFRQAYVADLDAIEATGADWRPAWSVYAELMDAGLELCVDAGLAGVAQAVALADFAPCGRSLAGIVSGLESLPDPKTLEAICHLVGPERLIFSLDLKLGVPLANSPDWQGLSALQIAHVALRAGVRRMIVLDLARVGMGQGVGTEPLCRQLACLDPRLEIIAGGGVRSPADLEALALAGCHAALVASALHDGRLSAAACVAAR